MKNVSEIVSKALKPVEATNVSTTDFKRNVDLSGALAEWFNEVFPEILMACPKWGLTISGDAMMRAAKRVWLQAMADGGVTKKSMVSRGIKALQDRGQEYLPSPAEFCALCKESGDKLPTKAEARLEIQIAKKPWSCAFVEYLAGKTGTILHPTTEKELRDFAFAIEYKKAVELHESGFFNQGETPQIQQKEMDSNLKHYFFLKNSFPNEKYADDFIIECRDRGINIDVASMTVTVSASVVFGGAS